MSVGIQTASPALQGLDMGRGELTKEILDAVSKQELNAGQGNCFLCRITVLGPVSPQPAQGGL